MFTESVCKFPHSLCKPNLHTSSFILCGHQVCTWVHTFSVYTVCTQVHTFSVYTLCTQVHMFSINTQSAHKFFHCLHAPSLHKSSFSLYTESTHKFILSVYTESTHKFILSIYTELTHKFIHSHDHGLRKEHEIKTVREKTIYSFSWSWAKERPWNQNSQREDNLNKQLATPCPETKSEQIMSGKAKEGNGELLKKQQLTTCSGKEGGWGQKKM